MVKVVVGVREFELNPTEEQKYYIDGFLLAAKFIGHEVRESDRKIVHEIKETEFGFFSGWRFALVRAGKFKTYYTTDQYVWRGAYAYLEKDPSAVLTDLYEFDSVHEGGLPIKLSYPEKSLVVMDSKDEYTLRYGPLKWSLMLNGEDILDMEASLPGTDFLDSIRESISDTLYMFMTKAFLTGLLVLPGKVTTKVIPEGLRVTSEGSYTKVIVTDHLTSPVLADYLSSVL